MRREDVFKDDQHAVHPGEILREEILPQIAIGRKELARHLGISTWMLVQILSERRPVTLDIAMRLGAALGHGTHYWIGLQAQHDLACANSLPKPTVRRVPWWGQRNRTDGYAASDAYVGAVQLRSAGEFA